jgi:superfamily II DNA helicase RecQ
MVLMKLTQNMVASNNNCSTHLLLVRPTGGGKSDVWDTFVVLLTGVMQTIMPLLSLAADQANKVMEYAKKDPAPLSSPTIRSGVS